MAKLRVYQLARELNRDNAEIIRELQHMGVPVTSHSNTVEDRLADRLRRELGVFAPDGGKTRSADVDDIVAVDIPDEEVAVAPEPVAVEPEPPRIEAKALDFLLRGHGDVDERVGLESHGGTEGQEDGQK